MRGYLDRLNGWFQSARAEHDSVSDEVLMINMRRLRWMACVVASLTLILGVSYWMGTTGATSRDVTWGRSHAWADFSMAFVFTLVGWAAHHVIQQGRATPVAQALVVLTVGWTLGVTIVTTTVDQMFLPGITAFLFGSITIGAVPLMRPKLSLPVFVGAYVVLYCALPITQHDPVLLQLGRVTGLAAVVLSFFVSVVLWRQSTADILRHRALQRSNAALTAEQNDLKARTRHGD